MDYAIGSGNGNQLLHPAIILNRCPVGGVVFLTLRDYKQGRLSLLGSFTVTTDFLDELHENLQKHPNTDLIYFRDEKEAGNFSEALESGIRVNNSGDPDLPPHISFAKCLPGCTVVFAKHELYQKEIVHLDHFTVGYNFIDELFENLEHSPETELIYFVGYQESKLFLKWLREIKKDENGRPILRYYHS